MIMTSYFLFSNVLENVSERREIKRALDFQFLIFVTRKDNLLLKDFYLKIS